TARQARRSGGTRCECGQLIQTGRLDNSHTRTRVTVQSNLGLTRHSFVSRQPRLSFQWRDSQSGRRDCACEFSSFTPHLTRDVLELPPQEIRSRHVSDIPMKESAVGKHEDLAPDLCVLCPRLYLAGGLILARE